jgi:prevent-host-death family protein
MAREITQRELRNKSGEIMRQLDHGESFIVTRNGAPVGELTPLRRLRFVSAVTAVVSVWLRRSTSIGSVLTSTPSTTQTPRHMAENTRPQRGILDTSVVIDLERLERRSCRSK